MVEKVVVRREWDWSSEDMWPHDALPAPTLARGVRPFSANAERPRLSTLGGSRVVSSLRTAPQSRVVLFVAFGGREGIVAFERVGGALGAAFVAEEGAGGFADHLGRGAEARRLRGPVRACAEGTSIEALAPL